MPETKKKTVKKTTKKAATKPNNAKLLKIANMKVAFLEDRLNNIKAWCAVWCVLAIASFVANLILIY